MNKRNFNLKKSRHRGEIFSSANQVGCGAHTVSYSVGAEGSSPGVKQPGRDDAHSPPSNTEVKN
jgi:hypothetical protein